MRFRLRSAGRGALAAALALSPLLSASGARASDHADTVDIAASPGTDLTDLFVFPSPENSANVVLAMCVWPLIPAGQGGSISFDPDVLYQFKIDTDGDHIEDLVIQATFSGTGPEQVATIRGPAAPAMTGTKSKLIPPDPATGKINTVFSPRPGMRAFAGVREDPFFFDLDRFYEIFPDRKTPLNHVAVANPNAPRLASWRPAGQAQDFLADFNVLSIVVELPRSDLGSGVIGVWMTTSR